ncbi:MAG: penicillin-binding transpeptidase domain-containing protein [Proteobacteria bacterium]|nr:penicillin-binding transpeptidase domain-containing protein [Pseudomonadota bacterium]
MRSTALRAACARVGALRAVFLILFAVLAGRAAHLTVIDTQRGEWQRDRQVHTTLHLPPARGLIVDRNGVELAVTVAAPSVYVLPSELGDRDAVVRQLTQKLGLSRRKLTARLRGRTRFTFVARWVDPDRARAVEALGLPGVGIVHESKRAYPGAELAAHAIGFANIDGEGVRGVEQQEDAWLRGSARSAPVERDGSGRLLATAAVAPRESAGGDVALTLDSRMQAEAERALRESLEKTGARAGTVLSLDPKTGEILAMAEAPSFDPNRFRELDYWTTRSRVFLDAVEPGSTLKIFLVASALEAGAIRASDRFDCSEGRIHVPGKWIHDTHDYGILDVSGVVRVSSNVGAVQIAQRLGPAAHHEGLVRFGFGASTRSGFPVESAGLLRPWREWKPLDHANIAFGQGIGVTPIQLAAATAALANGGVWIAPRLIAARRRGDGSGWIRTEPRTTRRVVSADTADAVLRMMEGVVGTHGTGRQAGLKGLRVAGKTGTAQKLDPETGSYSKKDFIAWFVGAVPADDPHLVIVAALDEPDRGAHIGGSSAAPLFARVAAAQLALLGIATEPRPAPAPLPETRLAKRNPTPPAAVEPEEERPAPHRPPQDDPVRGAEETPVRVTQADDDRILLPDFLGLSLDEVIRITSENQIELEFNGRGTAVQQEPHPGAILDGGDRRVFVRFAGARRGEG